MYTFGSPAAVHKHNVETANQISMKFCADIICRIETCRTIPPYSPGGATFQIALPVTRLV